MRFDSLTTVLAVSNVLLGVSAGPLAAKRQDGSSSITATPSSSAGAKETATSTSSQNEEGFVVSTLSDGTTTTYLVKNPNVTPTADATATQDTKTYTYSRTGLPAPISTKFPKCHAADAAPFCLPNNMSELYVGKTYYATWNPDYFDLNSTVTVKIQWSNDSNIEAWSSPETENSMGFVAVDTQKDWLQGYTAYNLTFTAINFKKSDPNSKSEAHDGPMITLMNEPPRHYPEPPHNSIDREGLLIGLPIGLGFVLIVGVGLFFGMRKHRTIGLGNVMGRRNRGYGVGKSRRQRMGLGKKGAIRLEEREAAPTSQYRDERGRARGDSLGSLVSDDDIRPAPAGNHFRDEMQRQRTGR